MADYQWAAIAEKAVKTLDKIAEAAKVAADAYAKKASA